MLPFILIICFFFMLLFPSSLFQGASMGITLWFHTVFPTLFPFFIMNALLLRTGTIFRFSRILSPLFGPFFRISDCSSYAVLCGFFCGTPIGAKAIVSLVTEQKITKEEGEYLLSFCNNTSPGFLIGFLFDQSLRKSSLAYPSLLIFWASVIISSFLFRPNYTFKPRHLSPSISFKSTNLTAKLDESIWESMEIILKIGGYIISFCVILFLLKIIPCDHFLWTNIFLPSLELTNGVKILSEQPLPFYLRYVLSMTLLSFGGLCAAFQTKCIISAADFSFCRYIKEKLITAIVTSFLSLLFIFFYLKFWR